MHQTHSEMRSSTVRCDSLKRGGVIPANKPSDLPVIWAPSWARRFQLFHTDAVISSGTKEKGFVAILQHPFLHFIYIFITLKSRRPHLSRSKPGEYKALLSVSSLLKQPWLWPLKCTSVWDLTLLTDSCQCRSVKVTTRYCPAACRDLCDSRLTGFWW